ncbi:MAG: LamG-like jellyroll fold domain-containing protein [Bacteroidota bacterium]
MFRKLLLVLFLALSITNTEAQTGIYFDGVNDYVTYGVAAGLGSSQFTLEVWFKREGTGVSANTGTGGVTAIPLITKGRNEAEGSNVDMNYFLGIDAATNVLVADFEEGAGQASPGLNHPVSGTTPICNFKWYHAAATYDGTTCRIYLNGNLEATLVVNRLPRSNSIQHAGLATAMNSTGVPNGYFNGRLDEARIWNYARSQAEVVGNLTSEISSAPGLIGRWGLNENAGTTCANSGSAGIVNGTLTNGPLWINGSPFDYAPASGNTAINFDGTNTYIGLGNPAALGLNQFTLEAWFSRNATGTATSTGTGGINAVPILTKGRAEADGDNRDMNYFLGIDPSTNVVMVDFEEGTGQPSPGLNHPLAGVTAINNNIWYHAAATYDGTTLKLYLNGILESQLAVGRLPQSSSIQPAAIGSAITSTSVAAGFFNGIIDEARIWNAARSQATIQSTINQQLSTPQAGMVARWGLNENCGIAVKDSSGNAIHSTVTGSNWYWDGGAPFNINVNNPPVQPTSNVPANNATNVNIHSALSVTVSDPENNNLSISYYAAPCPQVSSNVDFTIIGLPDTQFYTSELNGATNAMYKAQMTWVKNNLVSENIVFIEGLGDCVQNGDNGGNPLEWQRADTAMKIIEDPLTTMLPDGIPYGLNVGNHDQTPTGNVAGTTTFFNQYFGSARFTGRGYYGGHYSTKNNNNYSLFTASGLDFIVINLEYATTMDPGVITWLRNLLDTYSNRKAIIGSHYILNLNGTYGTQGQVIYNSVKDKPNVFMMLAGHVTGESRRQDTYSGSIINTIMSDFQGWTNGGNGWLRIMKFSPSTNTINVKTYNPWLNQWKTDAASQFTLNYNMQPVSNFTLIGTNTGVTSGTTSSLPYGSMAPNTCYQWYVVVSDGNSTTTSPIWTFTTGSATLPVNLLEFTAQLNQEEVETRWTTSSEINNDYFTIEKSNDGIQFEELSRVKGAGNSTTNRSYEAVDHSPYNGLSYYRLKQTDFDGTEKYSAMVPVKYNHGKISVTIFPNPTASGSATILLSGSVYDSEIIIRNVTGEKVYEQRMHSNENSIPVSLNHFAKGVYIVNVKTGDSETHQRLTVQ